MSDSLTNDSGAHAFLAPLNKQNIREYLIAYGLRDIQNINVFSSISSTNDYLLESALAKNQVSVCLSEQQTKGRGRYGHRWVSPFAANIYMSMSWPFQVWKEEYETLSLWLLIAIAELLENQGCHAIQLKWPNDVCVENKKLAGVLIERKVNQTKNALIVGVGLNVAMSLQNDVSIETPEVPWVDLLSIKSDWELNRDNLSAKIIRSFYNVLTKLEGGLLGDLNTKWLPYDMLLNQRVQFLHDGESNIGLVMGVDNQGKIILDMDGKIMHMHSAHIGEIKIIGNTE